jgi:hypothetical protein
MNLFLDSEDIDSLSLQLHIAKIVRILSYFNIEIVMVTFTTVNTKWNTAVNFSLFIPPYLGFERA